MAEIHWYEGPDVWAGTKVSFRKRGSSETLPVFYDPSCTHAAPNPITVEDGGLPRLYFDGGADVSFTRFGVLSGFEEAGV